MKTITGSQLLALGGMHPADAPIEKNTKSGIVITGEEITIWEEDYGEDFLYTAVGCGDVADEINQLLLTKLLGTELRRYVYLNEENNPSEFDAYFEHTSDEVHSDDDLLEVLHNTIAEVVNELGYSEYIKECLEQR